jgi:hypothetical protein
MQAFKGEHLGNENHPRRILTNQMNAKSTDNGENSRIKL